MQIFYLKFFNYLDKPNYSYIVHPSNHFEDFIVTTLEKKNRIPSNHISAMIDSKPDVIICNSMRIHRGVPTDNTNFKCNYEHYQNEYNQNKIWLLDIFHTPIQTFRENVWLNPRNDG